MLLPVNSGDIFGAGSEKNEQGFIKTDIIQETNFRKNLKAFSLNRVPVTRKP